MLVDATCDGTPLEQPLPVLARHLTFGLTNRSPVESDAWIVRGPTRRARGGPRTVDGTDVTVEAVVRQERARCVHDFLYVAPAGEFEDGRRDFRHFVESFEGDR